MDEKNACFKIKNGKIRCFDEKTTEEGSFSESRKFFVKKVETVEKEAPFHLVKNCKIQGVDCFQRNIKNAGYFFLLLLLAGLILNFMHEFVHYIFFVALGTESVSFSFASNIGFTTGDFPAFDDPSIPWWWWYFELMGPLLIVNLSMVVIAMSLVNYDVGNPPYDERTVAQSRRWFKTNFLKAIAYTSAFTILVNTIFSPFYKIFYQVIGTKNATSDFELAWLSSLYMPAPFGDIMRFLLIATVAVMVTVTILYIFLFNRRETEY